MTDVLIGVVALLSYSPVHRPGLVSLYPSSAPKKLCSVFYALVVAAHALFT